MKSKIKKMVIIITKENGTTKREVIGDDLEKEERNFISHELIRILTE